MFNPNLARRPILSSRVYFKRAWSSFTANDTSLTIDALKTSFSYVWLRDSCQSSPECIHPTTLQKLHRTSDIPVDIRPATNGIASKEDGFHIKWTDGHESFFHKSFLERHSSPENLFKFHKDVQQVPWDNTSITKSQDLFVPYDSLKDVTGLATAIAQLGKYGLLFVRGVPNGETSNETCELRTLAGLFGHIRPTFYGETWDVKNVRNSRNIAYTNLDLGLHMDLLYFEHPPRYQILHCLKNRVRGGTSIFVDAIHAASILRQSHPDDFNVLASTPVAYHYVNDGHHLHHEHPTIELASLVPPGMPPQIKYINYSPPFQAPLPVSTPASFYPALGRFAKLLNAPENTYEYTLAEGDAVLFDNRRVLHARTAFYGLDGSDGQVEVGKEGETNRWLKGCYLEADAVMDRLRVLKANQEK
ncbi:hypothetical protein AX16_007113 [Volvariella volvacea WC 439]|nr:hypothetical protein AX16_007113 [Volvariella volvacea WC 439]